jgi:hypothetical protein
MPGWVDIHPRSVLLWCGHCRPQPHPNTLPVHSSVLVWTPHTSVMIVMIVEFVSFVDIVGPSHIGALFQSIPPYWYDTTLKIS